MNKSNENTTTTEARAAVKLLCRETNINTMQACSSLRVYDNRNKRLQQVVNRATRGMW